MQPIYRHEPYSLQTDTHKGLAKDPSTLGPRWRLNATPAACT